jgi:plasmid replication initiation protein
VNLYEFIIKTKSGKKSAYFHFFGVVALEKKLEEHGIRVLVESDTMFSMITQRFDMYDKESNIYALKDRVLERARTCMCFVLSYESWIEALTDHEVYPAFTK